MAVHEFLQQLLELQAPAPVADPELAPTREGYSATMGGLQAEFARTAVALASVKDTSIPGPHGDIKVRVYRDSSAEIVPTLLYYHGGAWWLGDLELSDRFCRQMAAELDCQVISVDYRLAPEYPFPVPLDECYAVLEFVSEHAQDFGTRADALAVAGTSAGANLAAGVCLMARDKNGPEIRCQLLDIPALDVRMASSSYDEFASGYSLTREGMERGWRYYLGAAPTEVGDVSPLASPSLAPDLAGLPPAIVLTMEYDPLRDEGEAYAQRLADAGVASHVWRCAGMIHGSLALDDALPEAAAHRRWAMEQVALYFG